MVGRDDLDALRALLGEDGVVEAAQDRAAYETPARYRGGRAAAVLRPRDTAQTSAAVAFCVQRGLAFVPQSGNTGLVGSSVPDDSGAQLVLSLERLRAPLEVHAADRTAVVGAGVRLSQLNAALEPHGLFLPIDLGADPMVGGMAATNTGGARFLRYGDMRRHVLGLEVVLADARGTVLDLMSDLRKDNGRIDLRQLFVGSSGAFGVITRAALEVHPRPRETAACLATPRDAQAVIELLCSLEERVGETLTAFEYMSGAAMRRAFAHVPGLRNPFANGVVPAQACLIELTSSAQGGSEPLEDRLQAALAEIAEREGSPLLDAIFGRPDQAWALRHALSEGLRASGPVVGLDLSFARSRLAPFRAAVAGELETRFPEFELCDFGHAGDGGVHFNLVARDPQAWDPERGRALKTYVIERAVGDFGGSFSGEHGLGRELQSYYNRLTPPLQQAYAEQIRVALGVREPPHVRFGPPAS